MTELDDAVELAPYHDEPAQLPSGAPGKRGVLRLGFERRGDRTILADLHRQAPLLVQQALYWDEAMPGLACVFIITTSGGLLQGDRHTIRVRLAEHAQAHLTTQSATKIQQMDANYAAQTQDIALEEGAYLEYLPDPVIPYRNSRYITRTRVSLPESATMLYAEIILPGRKYHRDSELFGYDLFSSTLRVARPDGRELFVEKFVVEPGRFPVDRCAVMAGFHVLANVVLLTSAARAERVIDQVPVTFGAADPVVAGVSRLPNGAGLIYKVLGADSEPVRAAVRDFWALVRREIVGVPLAPAFSWR
ncbi:urease accessory protein UreD [Dactylosporangium sucinum]|uniref:Urease accessory protein UreD n=1 Tax=Dactylosporangium sucinum TaxID=1424081 RepID=A0A917WUE1_9ACTN|nr:urease accessory protein UreD [Dactylosporangium sucinum]GGM29590.1 urease accessory protein UreD [Dactylosporangium sucinum]